LGIVVYEMLTGARPFQPDTDSSLIFPLKLLELQEESRLAPRELRPDLPLEAERVLLKALAFNPANRFHDIAEFGHSFVNSLKAVQLDRTQPFIEFPSKPEFQAAELTVSTIGNNIDFPHSPRKNTQKYKFIFIALAASMAILLPLVLGILYIVRNNLNPSTETVTAENTTAAEPQVSLRYWLMVQKMRNGKAYQEPFKSSGQEIFENGYEFTIFLNSSRKGYLYFFNEGINEDKGNFWILFPTPARNDGKAKIDAAEELKSGWNVFSGNGGTEKFWLIWTEDEYGLLEDIRKDAFKSQDGSIQDKALKEKFDEFLASHSNQNLTVSKQEGDNETIIGGTGKIIVKQLKMEHR